MPADLCGDHALRHARRWPGYNTAGSQFNGSYEKGGFYEIKKPSHGGRWSWFPNAQSTSVVGVKMEEQIYQDWLLIGAIEFGYNPYSLMLINGPRSLAAQISIDSQRQSIRSCGRPLLEKELDRGETAKVIATLPHPLRALWPAPKSEESPGL